MAKLNGLGQVNVNLDQELREVDRKRGEERYHRHLRHNLGWTLRIEQVNPKAAKDFDKIRGTKVDPLYPIPQALSPGLYLDCTFHRENGRKQRRHTLYRLTVNGEFEHVMNATGGKHWRESLIPTIESELQNFPMTHIEEDTVNSFIRQANGLNVKQYRELKNRISGAESDEDTTDPGARGSSGPTGSVLAKLPQGSLTASRLGLAKTCPGSFTVGHVQSISEPGSPSDRGTQVHDFLEDLILTGIREPQKVKDSEARKICADLDPLHVMNVIRNRPNDPDNRYAEENFIAGPAEILAETPFALSEDALQAKVLPKTKNHRDYSEAPEGWTCGTVDAAVIGTASGTDQRAAVVTDWKTGALQGNPEKSLQLRFAALAVALAYDLSRVTAQFAYLGPGGNIHTSQFEFGPEDLDDISTELRRVVSATNDPRAPFVTGGHCRYCPAFAACPAQAGAAQAGAAQALLAEPAEELDPETAARAWERLQAVEAATKKVRKALQDYLENLGEGIPLTAGTELRLATSRRDTILAPVAMPILREHYGEAADNAVTVTKKGLKAVAGNEDAEVLAEIEEKEGIKTTYSGSLREYRKQH